MCVFEQPAARHRRTDRVKARTRTLCRVVQQQLYTPAPQNANYLLACPEDTQLHTLNQRSDSRPCKTFPYLLLLLLTSRHTNDLVYLHEQTMSRPFVHTHTNTQTQTPSSLSPPQKNVGGASKGERLQEFQRENTSPVRFST